MALVFFAGVNFVVAVAESGPARAHEIAERGGSVSAEYVAVIDPAINNQVNLTSNRPIIVGGDRRATEIAGPKLCPSTSEPCADSARTLVSFGERKGFAELRAATDWSRLPVAEIFHAIGRCRTAILDIEPDTALKIDADWRDIGALAIDHGFFERFVGHSENISAVSSRNGQHYREGTYDDRPIRYSTLVTIWGLIFLGLSSGWGCLFFALKRDGDLISGIILLGGGIVAAACGIAAAIASTS